MARGKHERERGRKERIPRTEQLSRFIFLSFFFYNIFDLSILPFFFSSFDLGVVMQHGKHDTERNERSEEGKRGVREWRKGERRREREKKMENNK